MDARKVLPPWYYDARTLDCTSRFDAQKKAVHHCKIVEIVDEDEVVVHKQFYWVLWEGF